MAVSKKRSPFEERFALYEDELKWLYCELYHNDMEAYTYFCNMLKASYKARKASLRKIDEERLANPDWYRSNKLLGMMLYVSQFADNLKGVKKKLPYLEECGVNYLHLMPLLKTVKGKSDGGYAVADFRTVQPELGTMKDLEQLANEAHKKGMCLCLDFVMNHTSEEHEWAKAARNGDPFAKARYFFYDDRTIPDEFEKTVPQVFPTTAPGSFTYLEDCNQYVMTNFYPYQWDLNYANPIVFNDMMENLLYLTNRGMDVIRLDAIPYIWKELGTNCRNLPQVHTLSRMMHLACKIVCPGVLLLGEVVMEPSKLAPYFGTQEKPECHMLYNATTMCTTWHTVASRDVRLLRYQMDQLNALPHAYMFQNYLRCHDDIGWGLDYDFLKQFDIDEVAHKRFLNNWFQGHYYGSISRGELYNDDPRLGDARMCGTTASLCGTETAVYENNEEALKRSVDCDIMLHAWVFSQSGIPVLYSGDEIGQLNDYTYHEDPEKWDDSRYIHRGKFDWDLAKYRTDASTRQGMLFKALRKLEQIRADEVIFRADADLHTIDTGSNEVFGLMREYGGEHLLTLFNFTEHEITLHLWDETYTDLISGEKTNINDITLPPFGFYWLKAYGVTTMTMKELAQMAGVSSSAVSRYLNGGSLSQDKRERIKKAMDETGYQPDAVAKMLRTGMTDQVGLIIPKLDSDAVTRMTRGASQALAREGYLGLLADTANDPDTEVAYLKMFQHRQVAGIIMMATVLTPQHEEILKTTKIPIVVVGQQFKQVPCVYHDDFSAAFDLTSLLLKKGRKHIAFVGVTERDVAVGLNRKKGVKAAMSSYGLDPSELVFIEGDFSLESGQNAMRTLLRAHSEVDGVLFATDRMAFGAIEVLKKAGKRVPEDISIAGMDDNWACEHVHPHLTSSHFYYKTSGETAVSLLMDMIRKKGVGGPVRQMMLSYRIIERDSI